MWILPGLSGILGSDNALMAETATFALTELLKAPVFDSSGVHAGRVREVALAPQDDPIRLAALVVRTRSGED